MNSDFQGIDPNQDDSMVIRVQMENFVVKKILVDQGHYIYSTGKIYKKH